MTRLPKLLFALSLAWIAGAAAAADAPQPLKVGIVGLVHGHVDGFFRTSVLTPAGGLLKRSDVQLVGIAEPDRKLFDAYAKRFHIPANLYFPDVATMVAAAHPQAVLAFTATSAHREVVEQCATLGVHVMMEKPLAFRYADALAMQRAAERGKIHVLVDYETTWYASNTQAMQLNETGKLGPLVKAVFRDGHEGPLKIHVQPEFMAWMNDPNQGGDGALVDFGCYGSDLMTSLMHGQAPLSVTAIAKRLQPDLYPKVDDEAEIILNYPNIVAIVQGSWNWPFSIKQMDLYGRSGEAKVIDSANLAVHTTGGNQAAASQKLPPRTPPYDDPLHYLAAVVNGQIQEGADPSSLKTNVIVAEILDAAWQSSQSGKTVMLPLPQQ